MIEGLIILGIAAIVIVVALFGTTIISVGASIVASISAMITGAVTGAANLLTSWYTWAIASDITNYYIGYIWLASWLSLFAYSGYKIATSDKKKWMNLVGRGSNYLGVILILFLVAQPLVVSFGASYLADSTALSEVEYNVTDLYSGSAYKCYTGGYNGSTLVEDQTQIFDNATGVASVASLVFDSVNSATYHFITNTINMSKFASSILNTFVFSYNYIGTGNITRILFYDVTNSRTLYDTAVAEPTTTFGSNQTVRITLEGFQAISLKSSSEIYIRTYFGDTGNYPSNSDYWDTLITGYTTNTIFTQETIMFWLALSIAALDIIGLLYATGVLQKYIL